MDLIELEVSYESDSEYFYSRTAAYLCIPATLPKSGQLIATLKEVHSFEDQKGAMKSNTPNLKMVQARENAFTAAQLKEAQTILDELRQGPETKVFTQFAKELTKQLSAIGELKSKYETMKAGQQFCYKLELLIGDTSQAAYYECERMEKDHSSVRKERLRKLLRYPEAWQTL